MPNDSLLYLGLIFVLTFVVHLGLAARAERRSPARPEHSNLATGSAILRVRVTGGHLREIFSG